MERFVASSGHVYEVTDAGPLSLLETLIQQRSSLRPFRFDCGTEDFLLAENRALNEGLTQARIPHEYAEHPGGHEWPYWQRHLADQLRFFADYL
jgi:S-formylglutathione hydrolase FrmB